MTVERWIAEQIAQRGIKQKWLAERAGMTEQKLSSCLTGRRNFKTKEFLSVCVAADINPLDYPGVGGEAHA